MYIAEQDFVENMVKLYLNKIASQDELGTG